MAVRGREKREGETGRKENTSEISSEAEEKEKKVGKRVVDPPTSLGRTALGEAEKERWVTQEEVLRLLEEQRGGETRRYDLDPPYPMRIACTPYPVGYQPLTFHKFDGFRSAREHLMAFIDDLRVYRESQELRMKEFSKSLTSRAFTWYTKLQPGSLHSWEDMAVSFYSKFLDEEGEVYVMDLGRMKQRVGEPLAAFIRQDRDKVLQCKETLPEANLVYGCIKNIEDGSRVLLQMSQISTFAKLLKRGNDMTRSLKHQGKRPKGEEAVYEVQEVRGWSEERRGSYRPERDRSNHSRPMEEWKGRIGRQHRRPRMERETPMLPGIPLPVEKVCDLVDAWIDEALIKPSSEYKQFTKREKKEDGFCYVHGSHTHGLMECRQIQRIFQRERRASRIILPQKGSSIHRHPLPRHAVNMITGGDPIVEPMDCNDEETKSHNL